ncbi:hypothetical protein [Pleurocapsa sp. PCC 7319]|uniref:hypothetical protein n=1 Tax=Pleurocapsa sp. PCC 7319 TaxID=118161 RepID=UPI00034B4987|nr:hypothetical protein [Pleurocapsa sp. PCC 7319]
MKKYSLFLCSITILLFSSTSLHAQSVKSSKQTNVSAPENLKNSYKRPAYSQSSQLVTDARITDEKSEELIVGQGRTRTRTRTRTSRPISYYGLGGNIGLGGDATAVGDGAFALLGKNAFSSNLAIHSGFLFGDDNVILASLTYGVPIKIKSYEVLYPFLGGGVLIEDLFSDFDLGGLVTGGVDVLITNQITGTARLNLGFADSDTDVGLLLGIGLNI